MSIVIEPRTSSYEKMPSPPKLIVSPPTTIVISYAVRELPASLVFDAALATGSRSSASCEPQPGAVTSRSANGRRARARFTPRT